MDEGKVYYVAIDSKQAGPLTLAEVATLLKSNKITKDTLYCKKGMKEWLPLYALYEREWATESVPSQTPPLPAMPARVENPNEKVNDASKSEVSVFNAIGKSRISFKTALIGMVFCVLLGAILFLYFTRPEPQEPETIVEYVVDDSKAIKRMKIGEAIITSFRQEQKLVVLETDLEEDVTIDQSSGDWGVFKKMQKMTIKATGRFTVDLGQMAQEDIVFDAETNQLAIVLPPPELDSVTVNEEDTVFYDIDKGFLRFGDIKLSAAEQNEIYHQAKEAMTTKLKLDMKGEAEKAAKESITDLSNKLLHAVGVDGYTLVVVWR